MKTMLYCGRSLATVLGLTLLLPIAMSVAFIGLALISGMFWMSAVHVMFTRYVRGEASTRFPVAERSDVANEFQR